MKKDLTQGSITKTIMITASPMVFALLLQTSFNIVDAIYVGRISAEAIAAVSLSFPIIFFIYALGGGIGVGATSLIARYIGAKKVKIADNVAEHALLASLLLSVFFTLIGLLFGKWLLVLIGAGSLLDMAWDYLRIIFLGASFSFVFMLLNSMFRGEGDTKTPMKYMLIATIANIILDPIFIFLLGMGIKGAATATVISNALGCISIVHGFASGKTSLNIRPKYFHFKFDILKKILHIGFPSSLAQMGMSLGMFFMVKIVSYFGNYAIAAFGIVSRLESIAILPALGIMMAIIPIVGQNVGAKKFDRVEKTAYKAAMITALFSGIVGILLFLFPSFFIRLFNSEPEVLGFGISYLKIVALTYAFIGIIISMNGAFLGTGNALTSMFLVSMRMFTLVVPLALLLAFVFDLGIIGVWLAFPIATVVSAVSSLLWFRTGRWKRKHLAPKEIAAPVT